MILLFIFLIPMFYSVIKISLYLLTKKYGKFSYNGFDAAGFIYDDKKDIFYSSKDAWQRNLGYGHLYDMAAPICRIIVDTEPIKFYYNDKNWLITFWKGQYGITTGAEIGIYCTKEKKIDKNTLYMPVNDNEMLKMSFILYKKKKEIMRLCSNHWWLAGFKLGMFSKPKNLTMDIKITFPNKEMLDAFFTSFKKLKHNKKSYKIIGNTFIFIYKKPHSKKIWTKSLLLTLINQHLNKKNVNLYNKYLSDIIDNDSDDKKINLNDFIPDILKNHPTNIGDNNE